MSEAKAAPKKASARKKAEASGAEAKGEAKTVDFRGLELEIPAKLPGTILFDLADVEAGRDLQGTMEFLKSLIGQNQYQLVREKVAADGIGFDEVIDVIQKLIEDILEIAGISEGE